MSTEYEHCIKSVASVQIIMITVFAAKDKFLVIVTIRAI